MAVFGFQFPHAVEIHENVAIPQRWLVARLQVDGFSFDIVGRKWHPEFVAHNHRLLREWNEKSKDSASQFVHTWARFTHRLELLLVHRRTTPHQQGMFEANMNHSSQQFTRFSFRLQTNMLQAMDRLHPQVTRSQKPWPQVAFYWLRFYEILTRYTEPYNVSK